MPLLSQWNSRRLYGFLVSFRALAVSATFVQLSDSIYFGTPVRAIKPESHWQNQVPKDPLWPLNVTSHVKRASHRFSVFSSSLTRTAPVDSCAIESWGSRNDRPIADHYAPSWTMFYPYVRDMWYWREIMAQNEVVPFTFLQIYAHTNVL